MSAPASHAKTAWQRGINALRSIHRLGDAEAFNHQFANPEREKAGYPAIQLVGWAQEPHYDRSTDKLCWAKEIKFGNNPDNTLNYNNRILGRGGVLVLNAVAGMTQLPRINQATPGILAAIEFNPGHRYADFDPDSDKVAEYGLAALVAGGVAAKMGLLVALLAAKKFVVVGVVAVAALFRKFLRRKSPATSTATNGKHISSLATLLSSG